MISLIQKYKKLYKQDLQSCRDTNICVYKTTSWLKLYHISNLEQSLLDGKGKHFDRALKNAIKSNCFCDRRIKWEN